MIFYSFYTDKFKDPKSLVYRTEDITSEESPIPCWSELQVNLKMFDSQKNAELDFMKILWDNPDFRTGEWFDTEKGKNKKEVKKIVQQDEAYKTLPSDFKLELDKVYNLKWEIFMPTLPDKYLDYVFTSPPYNITKQIGEGSEDLYNVYEDNLSTEEYTEWLCSFIVECLRVTKKHVFINIQMLGKNKMAVIEIQHRFRHYLKDRMIWQKSIVAPHIQPGIMNSAFEDIFIFSNDRPNFKVFSDAKWSQGTFNNVIKGINASQNKYRSLNKATFPLYLPRIFMQNFGKKGDIWFDPFSGTGTTFHAATIEERHFVGTEIDIEQCEATNKRIFVEEGTLKLDFGEGEAVYGLDYNENGEGIEAVVEIKEVNGEKVITEIKKAEVQTSMDFDSPTKIKNVDAMDLNNQENRIFKQFNSPEDMCICGEKSSKSCLERCNKLQKNVI